jgi:arylsulfatase B
MFMVVLVLHGDVFLHAAGRPNVVLIIADDLGYGETGIQGNSEIPTPHIDSLAQGGVRFTSGYVTSPYCSASRAGLMTGRIPNRFGYEFNPVGADNEDPAAGLPPSEQTIAEVLQNHGYATALIGKWHLGGTARYHPNRHGYDYFFGFTHEGHFFVPPHHGGVTTMLRGRALPDGGRGQWVSSDGHTILSTHMGHNEPDYDANNPLVRQSQPVDETEYLTDAFTREAVRFIASHADRPFFLTLAYNAVHSPLQARNEDMERLSHISDIHRRIFAAMLISMDDGIGRVLACLRDHSLDRNTLVIFLSDNGGPTRELTSSNAPLRGGKGTMFEGGIRVPFIIRWPARIQSPRVLGTPVSALDILPSILNAAGIPIPEGLQHDGLSWWPLLDSPDAIHPARDFFWRLGERQALRSGPWKIVRHPRQEWQLFHLGQDPAETSDLALRHPDRLRELIDRWESLNRDMQPPAWQR